MSNSMTPERAIEILKKLTYIKVLENNAHSNGVVHSESACKKDNEDLVAIQTAISALEYRIPKKPIYNDYTGLYVCPDCKKIIADSDDVFDFSDYCKFCGQALDWSDEE